MRRPAAARTREAAVDEGFMSASVRLVCSAQEHILRLAVIARAPAGVNANGLFVRDTNIIATLTGRAGGLYRPGRHRISAVRKIDLTNFRLATSGTARDINRRIALNIIRRHQPMSRADLARRSGLQRSTVSAIIDQLIDEGWVTEGASAVSARGRRPRFLHLNVERAGIVAVDLRPGMTKVGLAGLDARFVMQTDWPTPARPEEFARKLARTVTTFRGAHPEMVYEGVGVSLPGRVDESGALMFAPNLGWGRVNLRQLLESTLDLPVAFENAA